MSKHRQLPGGYVQVSELCDAERDIHEAMSIMEMIVKTISLPAQALTLMLKVVFLLVNATSAIHRAREISRNARQEREEE